MSNLFKLIFTADSSEVKRAFETIENGARDASQRTQQAFSGIESAVSRMKGALAMAAAAMAGGTLFANTVQSTKDVVSESKELARVLGITVTQASAMRAGFDSMQLTQEQVVSASQKLQAKLVENEASFTRLGIATRDGNGNFRNTFDILVDVSGRLNQFKAGTDRNIEGAKLFGKSWGEMAEITRLNKDALADAEDQARSTGQLLSGEMVSSVEQYIAAQNDMDDAVEGAKVQIGLSLMPVLASMATAFGQWIPAAIEAGKTAWNSMLFLFQLVRTRIMQLADVYKTVGLVMVDSFVMVGKTMKTILVDNVAVWIVALVEAFGKVLDGDFAGAKQGLANAFRTSLDNVMVVVEEYRGKISGRLSGLAADIVSSEDELTNFASVLGEKPTFTTAGVPGGGGGGGSTGGGKPKPGAKPPSQMPVFEQELAEQRVEAERAGQKLSLEQERAFWEEKKKLAGLSQADLLAITRKTTQLELQIEREAQEQKKRLTEQDIAFQEAKAQKLIELDQMIAQDQLANGQITQEQMIQQLRQLEERRYQIQVEALQKRKALAADDVVAQKQLQNDLELAAMDHNQRMVQLSMQANTARSADYEALQSRMSSLWDQGINAMMNGTLRMNNALKAIGAQMVAWFITDVVGKRVKAWLLGEATQTGATQAGVLTRLALEAWGAIKSLALTAGMVIKKIMMYAWEAMAGAYKAMVGIPYIGPILGVAAGAAAFAGVSALVNNVASASGGYDIPAGVNPLTQLHQREMVLPAKYADVIRDMADTGAANPVQPIVNIHAVDGRSVERMLRDNPQALRNALRDLQRNNKV